MKTKTINIFCVLLLLLIANILSLKETNANNKVGSSNSLRKKVNNSNQGALKYRNNTNHSNHTKTHKPKKPTSNKPKRQKAPRWTKNKAKKGYKLNEKVYWNKGIYISIINQNHQKPRGHCRTKKKCVSHKNKWKLIRNLSHFRNCRQIRHWEPKVWPKNARVKYNGHAYRATINTKINQKPSKSKVWRKLGKCKRGVNCKGLNIWEEHKTYKKGSKVRWYRNLYVAKRNVNKKEIPGVAIHAWKKLRMCRRDRKNCKGITKWTKLTNKLKYQQGALIKRKGNVYIAAVNTNSKPNCFSKNHCRKTKSKWIYFAKCKGINCRKHNIKQWRKDKWYKKGTKVKFRNKIWKASHSNKKHEPHFKSLWWIKVGYCKRNRGRGKRGRREIRDRRGERRGRSERSERRERRERRE